MTQNESHTANNVSQVIGDEDEGRCSCEMKQCMIGLASIVIGIGGFVLASLL